MTSSNGKIHLFVGGLHRSGTTPLFRCLREHPLVSGFRDVGVPQDEGQFLQDVYPHVNQMGGAGCFSFYPGAHLTEAHAERKSEVAERLSEAWRPYWGHSERVLMEKTPQNLIMSRFLQACFPESAFVFIVRHPIVTSLSTLKWAQSSLSALMEHWIRCHSWLAEDVDHLDRFMIIRYEDFVRDPDSFLARIFSMVGLEAGARVETIRANENARYEAIWEGARKLEQVWVGGDPSKVWDLPVSYERRRRLTRGIVGPILNRLWRGDAYTSYLHRQVAHVRAAYGERVRSFGYSLEDLNHPVVLQEADRGFPCLTSEGASRE